MATRRIGYIRDSSNLFEATDDEYLVASILLELRHLTAESDPRPRFPLSWGAKKKRRFTDETPSQRRLLLGSLPLPLPPPPPVVTTPLQGSDLLGPEGHAAGSSPATPLSFCPSESDENPKHSKRKVSEKKTRKEWLDTIEEVTKRNTFFEKEMEKLKSYYKELKAKNLRLKTRKQESQLSHSNRIGKFRLKASTSNSNSTGLVFEMKLGQTAVKSSFPRDNQDHRLSHFPGIAVHQSSFIINRTATRPEPTDYYYPQQCGRMVSLHTPGGGLGNKTLDDVCPHGIPDLNLSPVDSPWTDSNLPSGSIDNKSFSRVVAAHARHRRMQICRDKNSGVVNKLRISFR